MPLKFVTVLISLLIKSSSAAYLECHICDSRSLSNCSSDPTGNLPKSYCEEDEHCATSIMNGITYRNCRSKITEPESEDLIAICNTDLCNNSIFPENRLLCYQCTGENCVVLDKNIQAKPCQYYRTDDQCFTLVYHLLKAVRNCLSYQGDECTTGSCQTCSNSGCNSQPGMRNHSCIECDHTKGSDVGTECARQVSAESNCNVTNLNTCTQALIPGQTGFCYTLNNQNVIRRGCGMGEPTPPEYLQVCNTNLCNNECIDLKCLICDSIVDHKCKNYTSGLKAFECTQQHTTCTTCEDVDGRIVRGCGPANAVSHAQCYECWNDDGCNKRNQRTCFQCSSATDPNCAQWKDASKISTEICVNPAEQCVVSLTTSGSQIIRGCAGSVHCNTDDPSFCVRCNGSLCNSEVVPADRLQCHQCSGKQNCSNVLENENISFTLSPCSTYRSDDSCILYSDKHGVTRGCLSDKEKYNECKQLGPEICSACSVSGCNNQPLTKKPNIMCIQCEKPNEHCEWGFTAKSATICSNYTEYYVPDGCYIFQDRKGAVIRGCNSKSTYSCPDDATDCFHCSGSDGCNNRNVILQSCLQCNSSLADQADCEDGTERIKPTFCPSIIQTYANRGCYSKKDGYSITRGCFEDSGWEDLENCDFNEVKCDVCREQNCNFENWSRSGTQKMREKVIRPLAVYFWLLFYIIIKDS